MSERPSKPCVTSWRAAERGGVYSAGTFETHITYGTIPAHAPSYQVRHAYVMTTAKGELMRLVGAFAVDSVLQVTAPGGMGY